MPDIILVTFIGIGGVIAGTIIGGILAHCSGTKLIQKTHENDLRVMRITEFNKAAALFREAFVMEIFLLRENINTGDHMPNNIINRDALIAHEKAKILFEPFVPLAELERFNQAWEKYKKGKAMGSDLNIDI